MPSRAVNGFCPAICAPRTAHTAHSHSATGTGPAQDHHANVLISANAPPPSTTSCAGVYGPKGTVQSPSLPSTHGCRRALV